MALAITAPARAGSSAEEAITFWTVAVAPFEGKTDELTGARASIRFANGLRDSRRFNVVAMSRVARELKKRELRADQALDAAQLRSIADDLHAHGMITGAIQSTEEGGAVLKLWLHSATGKVVTQVEEPIPADPDEKKLGAIGARLAESLPYDALIVRVAGQQFLVNAGSKRGVKEGSKLYGFNFKNVKETSSGYDIGRPQAVSELLVLRVSDYASWVQPVRGRMPEYLMKVSLEPMDLELSPDEGGLPAPPRPLVVAATLSMLTRNYQHDSTEAAIDSKTTLFPAPGLAVDWIPWTSPWVDARTTASYVHGFVPFRRDNPNTGAREEFKGSVDDLQLAAGFSRAVRGGRFADACAWFMVGYRYRSFSIEEQDPLVLTSDVYHQLTLELGGRIPVFEWLGQTRRRFFFVANASYVPATLALDQKPVDDGAPEVTAFAVEAGLALEIFEGLQVAATWQMDRARSEFDPAGGSRGFTNASLQSRYQGMMLRVQYRLWQ